MKTGISVEQALALVLDSAEPRRPVQAPLLDARGCVLAEDAASDIDLPPFDNSAMDGYAVRAADVARAAPDSPVALPIIEEIQAGQVAQQSVGPGQAMRIFTGAPLPDGANAVVIQENTERQGDTVLIKEPLKIGVGENIRWAGEDVHRDDVLLTAGTPLTPACVALLAATGNPQVTVYPAPTVGILSTGDELVDIADTPGPGQIRSSNTHALLAQVAACGAHGMTLGIAADTDDSVRDHLARGSEADIVLTSGGVSVGEHDIMKDVLIDMGMEMIFWRVHQKPGNPLAFGIRRRDAGPPQLIFGLPGNPAATQVCFEEYVRPAIKKMMGFAGDALHLPRLRAVLDDDIKGTRGRLTFVRGVISEENGHVVARSAGGQSSGMLLSMARANALLIVPPDVLHVRAGEEIEAHRLPDG